MPGNDVLRLLALFHTLFLTLTSSCILEYFGSEVKVDCHSEVRDTIPQDISTVPDQTTELIFSSNRLSNITYNGMLSRFFNIQVLDFSHNYITQDSFRPDVFNDVKTLAVLNLQRNRITKVCSPFIRNAQIKILKLDYNIIKHISADFLVNLPRLNELTLSHCEIESISGQAFRSIGLFLEKLDLSDNRLETLSLDLRPDLFSHRIQSIRLYNNFWNCDCHLRWLRQSINLTSANWFFRGYELMPKCEEPKTLKHKRWDLANDAEFGCPPILTVTQNDTTLAQGDDLTLTCSVITYTEPYVVQWLQNDVTIDDYDKPRLSIFKEYDGSHLNTTLTIKEFTERDYGLYECNVNTTFGWVTQKTRVLALPASPLVVMNYGVTVAIVIVCLIVLVILALVITFYLKKHLVRRGKLYMDANSEMSQKSETDLSGSRYGDSAADITVTTPLNSAPINVRDLGKQPDVIKCYPDEDELDSLPADSEYPIDDAGCAEYNEYLEAVSTSANHSPDYIEPANSGPTYIRTISPNNRMPAHINPSSQYAIDTNHMRKTPPPVLSQYELLANHNGSFINPANQLAPYTETPASSTATDCTDSLSFTDVVASRVNSTPSNSPLTFIKEEPNKDVGTMDLL